MKILNMLVILGVIGVVTAAGIAIGGSMTGHSIFGGDDENSASDFSKGEIETALGNIAGDYDNSTAINNSTENETIVETTSSGGGGGGGSSGDDDDSEPEPSFDLCSSDLECDDGNDLTIDSCKSCIYDESTSRKECVYLMPNLHGKVYDTDQENVGVEGIEVSFYDSSQYDPYEMTGDYEGLAPKDTPDLVTDDEGEYHAFIDPDEEYHLVFNGSDEKSFNVKGDTLNNTITTETKGYIKVYFEKASATLKSDLYIDFENGSSMLLVEESEVGKEVYINDSVYDEGTEIRFHIKVDGSVWNALKNHNPSYASYDHYSDSKYCQVERLDKDTWRLHFEDLPDWWPPDWDFNDAVVLVDIINTTEITDSNYDENNDCDKDGIVNWLDYDDDSCDFGQEDTEIEEEDVHGNFNAEGHIIYSGEYGPDNKYVCGDKLKFTMFGINNRDPDETITFMVEDHSVNTGTNGTSFYTGNISNPNESLFVPNDGIKHNITIDYEIPCALPEGKHDIHIMWNGEKLHKIGNFFVIEDTTAPGANIYNMTGGKHFYGYPGEQIQVSLTTYEIPTPGTMNELNLGILSGVRDTFSVEVDENSDGMEIHSYPGDYEAGINISYNSSGEKTIKFVVKDATGNEYSEELDVTIFITEEEANETAYNLYSLFGLLTLLSYNVDDEHEGINFWDRYTLETDKIADEYYGPNDNFLQDNINTLNNYGCGDPYVRVFGPVSTVEEYNQTIYNHLFWLKCTCNETVGGGPDCPIL